MTLTFNPEIYSELLSKHQPRIIKTEEENENFLTIVEEFLSRPNLTPLAELEQSCSVKIGL